VSPADGSTASPFLNCQINADPSTYLPQYYAVQTTKAQGCFLEQTPLACRCAGDYSCACLKLNSTYCTGTNFQSCDEHLGAPLVTCN